MEVDTLPETKALRAEAEEVAAVSKNNSSAFEVIVQPDDSSEPLETVPLRSVPKSGRIWKKVKDSKFSALVKDKGVHTSWKKKQALREELALAKSLEQQICDQKRKMVESKKAAREEHEKRRIANEQKAEVVVPSARKLMVIEYDDEKGKFCNSLV
ncbi:unnamed protein product [Soboliphyme baturini]|uniref:Coiled-coil domain-containing protein 86 n=1 Tax=Soboliphyme baturini TaxID=241478 RepID=A0A183JAS5_9BILA|nr:unnamed protein product [Soboliphyme baturini]